MASISYADHTRFCNKLKDSINSFEKASSQKDIMFDQLNSLKKDLEILNNTLNQYLIHYDEIQALSNYYNTIQHRARVTLRRQQLLLKKVENGKD